MGAVVGFKVDFKFEPTKGYGKKLCGQPVLPYVEKATNSVFHNAKVLNGAKYEGMDNENYYHHTKIDSSGFARGDVELGNIRSMQDEKKKNYLLKALNSASI